MKLSLKRDKPLDLDRRLEALREVCASGEGRLPAPDLDAGQALLRRAGERLELGSSFTVVALAGATGSGKSSLFNALAGAELSRTGVRRPTTGEPHAAVWGDADASRLLTWLGVPSRHRIEDPPLEGLVLLDLPDHDSTELSHRLEVDRMVDIVDLFIWVVDPQKYADAALHDGYLRPLATHAAVSLVVLNQVDRLSAAERARCAKDLERLLAEDGSAGIRVIETSARTGEGIDELRRALSALVAERRASQERLSADLDALAARLSGTCQDLGKEGTIPRQAEGELTAAFADAAGADLVTTAVARSYLRGAGLVTGWPLTRWLRRLRPDPLRRLHLGKEVSGGRTNLRLAPAVERARVENALRSVASAATASMPPPWPTIVRERSVPPIEPLLDQLDRAIARADIDRPRLPAWWRVGQVTQLLLAVIALLGFMWLTVLFALEWFGIPLPPTPEVRSLPWPTLLLFGGLLAGLVMAGVFRVFAGIGAGRRRRAATGRIRAEIRAVVKDEVLQPLREELEAIRSLCRHVDQLRR